MPADGDDTGEDAPERRRHVHEAKGRDSRPELDTIRYTDGQSDLQALIRLFQGCASEKRMYTEEVRIENGCEDSLLYGDFGENGKEFGLEVEAVVKEHEPSDGASHQPDVLHPIGRTILTSYRSEWRIRHQPSNVAWFSEDRTLHSKQP